MAEVQRHLRDYIKNELFRGTRPPSPSRRRFYPTTEDIRNILNTQRAGARKATDSAFFKEFSLGGGGKTGKKAKQKYGRRGLANVRV